MPIVVAKLAGDATVFADGQQDAKAVRILFGARNHRTLLYAAIPIGTAL
jgi:hypothetical protein